MNPLPPPPYPPGNLTPPPGFTLVFSPMPQAPSGGYLVALGFTYRFAATLGGFHSPSKTEIAAYVKDLGFDQVVVWMKGETLPPDWVNPPNADAFVQGRCQAAQTIPVSKSVPLVINGTIIDARWWGYQPNGVNPNPPPPPVDNTATSNAGKWFLGAVILLGGVAAAEWWRKRRRR